MSYYSKPLSDPEFARIMGEHLGNSITTGKELRARKDEEVARKRARREADERRAQQSRLAHIEAKKERAAINKDVKKVEKANSINNRMITQLKGLDKCTENAEKYLQTIFQLRDLGREVFRDIPFMKTQSVTMQQYYREPRYVRWMRDPSVFP
jgi:hypothetical protein